MDADSLVRAVAMEFYGTPTLYKDLAEGDQFIFPRSPEDTFVKRTRGWYTNVLGVRRFRTGMRTAVIRLVP